MDYEHQGWITNGAAADILEFLIPEASPESANELLNVSDDLDDDGGMVRWEFVALCSMLLDIDDLPIERLKVCSIACSGTLITSHHRLSHLPLSLPFSCQQLAAENYQFAKAQEKRYYTMRWLRIGRQIDSFTLRFLIVAYLTSLLLLFSIDLRDRYQRGEEFEHRKMHNHIQMQFSWAYPYWWLVVFLPVGTYLAARFFWWVVPRMSGSMRRLLHADKKDEVKQMKRGQRRVSLDEPQRSATVAPAQ